MSFSQLGQDLAVVEFYKGKEGGYFVEVGASDGIELSNSFLLETKYKWKGICCEPIPLRFQKLVVNRPNSICFNDAIYSKSGLSLTFSIAHADLLSGISKHITAHKSRVNINKSEITVNTLTLTDALDKANAPRFIEYLSLDTEGSELEILKSFDFSKYTFGLIDVEHNYQKPIRSQIRSLLLSKGYVYKGENHFDDMYKHSSLT